MNIKQLNEKLSSIVESDIEAPVEYISDTVAEAARKGIESIDYILGTYGIMGTPVQTGKLDQIEILENARELLRSMVPELQ